MTENHPNTLADEGAEEIDVEEIMQQIRARILAEQANLPQYGETLVDISGKRFSPEFYEHLYRANLERSRRRFTRHACVNSPTRSPGREFAPQGTRTRPLLREPGHHAAA